MCGWAISLMEEIKKYKDISFSVALPIGGKQSNRYYEICRNVYDFSYPLNAGILHRGKKLQKIIRRQTGYYSQLVYTNNIL